MVLCAFAMLVLYLDVIMSSIQASERLMVRQEQSYRSPEKCMHGYNYSCDRDISVGRLYIVYSDILEVQSNSPVD